MGSRAEITTPRGLTGISQDGTTWLSEQVYEWLAMGLSYDMDCPYGLSWWPLNGYGQPTGKLALTLVSWQ